jgi:GT2 family glycosyltransferase
MSGPEQHTLDVVIVNWNSGDLLKQCIAALAASSVRSQLNVVVVDNASTDDSLEAIESAQLDIAIIRNPANRGFGAACNQGASKGNAPFILFLNPDTRVGRETFQHALDEFRATQGGGVGVMGIRLIDDAGRTQRTCARRPTFWRLLAQNAGLDRVFPKLVPPHFMTDWDHESNRDVDQVMGAFLLIERKLFGHLGGFDERYFV